MSEPAPRPLAAARPPADASAPPLMPVLGRGRHRDPARGACFMEYTSLLAGERFSDSPRCVDGELAAVLRGANDTLSDADRPALVPLLGRAIGLVATPPAPEPAGRRFLRRRSRLSPGAAILTQQLHRAVLDRFLAAVDPTSSAALSAWYRRHTSVSHLFWDLMGEPTLLSQTPDYVHRLVERVTLLHRCYEEAMAALGLSPGQERETARPTAGERSVEASPAG